MSTEDTDPTGMAAIYSNVWSHDMGSRSDDSSQNGYNFHKPAISFERKPVGQSYPQNDRLRNVRTLIEAFNVQTTLFLNAEALAAF